jgi:hypothetical protein
MLHISEPTLSNDATRFTVLLQAPLCMHQGQFQGFKINDFAGNWKKSYDFRSGS